MAMNRKVEEKIVEIFDLARQELLEKLQLIYTPMRYSTNRSYDLLEYLKNIS